MNETSKLAIALVLAVAISGGSFQAGRKSVKSAKALVYDVASKTWVPLSLKTDTKIAVASPQGTEPGVAYKFAVIPSEGPVVFILPPSLIPDDSEPPAPPAPPEPPGAPTVQPQDDDPRLDHADFVRISF